MLTKLLISYPILELASIFWYHWMCNIQEGTIHMLTYSYTERNQPQKIKIRATPTFLVLFISTGKMYTTSGLVSISYVHAVFALPSVPRVFILYRSKCIIESMTILIQQVVNAQRPNHKLRMTMQTRDTEAPLIINPKI